MDIQKVHKEVSTIMNWADIAICSDFLNENLGTMTPNEEFCLNQFISIYNKLSNLELYLRKYLNYVMETVPLKYSTIPIAGETNDERWEHLHKTFPENVANKWNLLMGSTSGIHGSDSTLNNLKDPTYLEENMILPPNNKDDFTICIIQPRICRMQYGAIGIRNEDDDAWLRKVIASSVETFTESQKGNI